MRIHKLSMISVRKSIGPRGNRREHNGEEEVVDYGPGRTSSGYSIDGRRAVESAGPLFSAHAVFSGVRLHVKGHATVLRKGVSALFQRTAQEASRAVADQEALRSNHGIWEEDHLAHAGCQNVKKTLYY